MDKPTTLVVVRMTWTNLDERNSQHLRCSIHSLLLTMLVKGRVRIVVADGSACKESQSPHLEIPTCSKKLFEHWASFCRKLSKCIIVMTAILGLCAMHTWYCMSCVVSLCLYSNYIVWALPSQNQEVKVNRKSHQTLIGSHTSKFSCSMWAHLISSGWQLMSSGDICQPHFKGISISPVVHGNMQILIMSWEQRQLL